MSDTVVVTTSEPESSVDDATDITEAVSEAISDAIEEVTEAITEQQDSVPAAEMAAIIDQTERLTRIEGTLETVAVALAEVSNRLTAVETIPEPMAEPEVIVEEDEIVPRPKRHPWFRSWDEWTADE